MCPSCSFLTELCQGTRFYSLVSFCQIVRDSLFILTILPRVKSRQTKRRSFLKVHYRFYFPTYLKTLTLFLRKHSLILHHVTPPKAVIYVFLCCVTSFDGEHYLHNASTSGLSAEPSGEVTKHTLIGSFQRELSELKREMQPIMGNQY